MKAAIAQLNLNDTFDSIQAILDKLKSNIIKFIKGKLSHER